MEMCKLNLLYPIHIHTYDIGKSCGKRKIQPRKLIKQRTTTPFFSSIAPTHATSQCRAIAIWCARRPWPHRPDNLTTLGIDRRMKANYLPPMSKKEKISFTS